MSVTWGNASAFNHGTGATAAPTYPGSIAVDDLLLLVVAWANTTNVAPTTPAGWTAPPNNTYTGGAGAFGVDTGPRGVTVFYRIADGTESGSVTVTNPGTTPTISAQIIRLSKTGATWELKVVGGGDTTSDTAYSVTAASDPGAVAGDHAIVVSAWHPDTATSASPALTWTGTGTATLTARAGSANTAGNDLRATVQSRDITGTSTAAPVYTTTLSAAGAGASAILLVHDIGPYALTRSLSETAPTSDATVKTEGEKRRDLDDTGPAADTLTTTSTRARAAGDAAAAADTTSAVVTALRSTSDTAAALDATARANSTARPVGDTAPAADAATRATSRARSRTEPTAAVDTTARLLGLTRAPSDAAAAADATAPTIVSGALTRTTAETAPATDANTRTTARNRGRTEPAGPVADSLAATRALARGIGEPTSLSDLSTRARRVSRALLDLALAGDITQSVTTLGPVPLPGRILAARLTTPQARARLTVPSVRGTVEAPRIAADLTAPTARGSLT
jgi:hypothetical protein